MAESQNSPWQSLFLPKPGVALPGVPGSGGLGNPDSSTVLQAWREAAIARDNAFFQRQNDSRAGHIVAQVAQASGVNASKYLNTDAGRAARDILSQALSSPALSGIFGGNGMQFMAGTGQMLTGGLRVNAGGMTQMMPNLGGMMASEMSKQLMLDLQKQFFTPTGGQRLGRTFGMDRSDLGDIMAGLSRRGAFNSIQGTAVDMAFKDGKFTGGWTAGGMNQAVGLISSTAKSLSMAQDIFGRDTKENLMNAVANITGGNFNSGRDILSMPEKLRSARLFMDAGGIDARTGMNQLAAINQSLAEGGINTKNGAGLEIMRAAHNSFAGYNQLKAGVANRLGVDMPDVSEAEFMDRKTKAVIDQGRDKSWDAMLLSAQVKGDSALMKSTQDLFSQAQETPSIRRREELKTQAAANLSARGAMSALDALEAYGDRPGDFLNEENRGRVSASRQTRDKADMQTTMDTYLSTRGIGLVGSYFGNNINQKQLQSVSALMSGVMDLGTSDRKSLIENQQGFLSAHADLQSKYNAVLAAGADPSLAHDMIPNLTAALSSVPALQDWTSEADQKESRVREAQQRMHNAVNGGESVTRGGMAGIADAFLGSSQVTDNMVLGYMKAEKKDGLTAFDMGDNGSFAGTEENAKKLAQASGWSSERIKAEGGYSGIAKRMGGQEGKAYAQQALVEGGVGPQGIDTETNKWLVANSAAANTAEGEIEDKLDAARLKDLGITDVDAATGDIKAGKFDAAAARFDMSAMDKAAQLSYENGSEYTKGTKEMRDLARQHPELIDSWESRSKLKGDERRKVYGALRQGGGDGDGQMVGKVIKVTGSDGFLIKVFPNSRAVS